MASASKVKLVITSIPTRNSVQASDRRDAMFFLSYQSAQETFDVFIIRPAKQLVRSVKCDLSVAQHQKPGVGDAQSVTLGLELNTRTVRGVLCRKSEGVTHAVGHEQARDALDIAQRDDEFVDSFRCNGV